MPYKNIDKRKACIKTWHLAHRDELKIYMRAYHLAHYERIKLQNKKWAREHPDKIKASIKKWVLANPEKVKTQIKIWEKANPDKVKARGKKYRLTHPEIVRERIRKYRQTPKGKEVKHASDAKRKKFGFVPLNKHLPGTEGHHVDRERVIYIPKELHHSIWHSVTLNINMDKINNLAFTWLEAGKL